MVGNFHALFAFGILFLGIIVFWNNVYIVYELSYVIIANLDIFIIIIVKMMVDKEKG